MPLAARMKDRKGALVQAHGVREQFDLTTDGLPDRLEHPEVPVAVGLKDDSVGSPVLPETRFAHRIDLGKRRDGYRLAGEMPLDEIQEVRDRDDKRAVAQARLAIQRPRCRPR